eukprot:gb/GFBE01004304.1/.p1 GENE.gb/GFBE01004304.1/~~gb/GFBE01004304.1/.p1  ORF type:complete len:155 (+),score=32.68 gb/GFBE01004304.1/:1-465(+)
MKIESSGGTMLDFYDIYWKPFGEVLVNIEARGIFVDQDHLKAQLEVAEQKLKEELVAFRDWLRREWERSYPDDSDLADSWRTFNPQSIPQMRHLLFGKDKKVVSGIAIGGLGLPDLSKGKQGTGSEVIKQLAGKDPEAGESGCGIAFSEIGQEG